MLNSKLHIQIIFFFSHMMTEHQQIKQKHNLHHNHKCSFLTLPHLESVHLYPILVRQRSDYLQKQRSIITDMRCKYITTTQKKFWKWYIHGSP